MRVLVTGGAGFIGSHLVSALLGSGHEVTVVDDLSTGDRGNLDPGASFVELDINDDALAEVFVESRPEAVVMLAFNTDVPKSVDDPVVDSRSLTGSVRTLELCRQYGARRVVFASSSFVYGAASVIPTPESAPTVFANPYVITKSAAEQYAYFYQDAYGLEPVVFRLATTYGPRQQGGAMADYIRSIYAGRSAKIYGDGGKTRDYIYVADVVDAMLSAIRFDFAGSEQGRLVLNLGTGRETSLLDLYKRIGQLLGDSNAVPDFEADRPGEIMRTSLDSALAKELFNWVPRVDLTDGLSETIDYYLASVAAPKYR